MKTVDNSYYTFLLYYQINVYRKNKNKIHKLLKFPTPSWLYGQQCQAPQAREIIPHYHRPSNSIRSRKHLLDNVSKTSSPKELHKIKRTFYLVPDNMPHIQMGFQCMSIKITIGAFQVPGRN
jgi:hypothetical protein